MSKSEISVDVFLSVKSVDDAHFRKPDLSDCVRVIFIKLSAELFGEALEIIFILRT